MPSFIDIVENEEISKDDIKDVPPLPFGHYLAMVQGPHENTISNEKKTPGMRFKLRLLQPRDDVDSEALAAFIEASRRDKLMDIELDYTIWESPFALQNLRDFVYDSLGVDGTLPIRQALAEVPGKDLIVQIIHRPFTDNQGNARLRAEIRGTARSL